MLATAEANHSARDDLICSRQATLLASSCSVSRPKTPTGEVDLGKDLPIAHPDQVVDELVDVARFVKLAKCSSPRGSILAPCWSSRATVT